MGRPAVTLVYVSRRNVARADFRGGKLAGVWSRPRPAEPDHASAVELAMSLGEAPGRRVWVLASELSTQQMSGPAAKLAGHLLRPPS